MLKKFEVKSHPHPERPDRLRAIAASLDTAGMLSGEYQYVSFYNIILVEVILVLTTFEFFCRCFPWKMLAY